MHNFNQSSLYSSLEFSSMSGFSVCVSVEPEGIVGRGPVGIGMVGNGGIVGNVGSVGGSVEGSSSISMTGGGIPGIRNPAKLQ